MQKTNKEKIKAWRSKMENKVKEREKDRQRKAAENEMDTSSDTTTSSVLTKLEKTIVQILPDSLQQVLLQIHHINLLET